VPNSGKKDMMDVKRIIAVIVVVIMGSLMLSRKEVTVNVQRFVITTVVVVAVGVVLSSRITKQSFDVGIIAKRTKLSVGHPTSNFPVVTTDGQQTSFDELREPIAIVAFVSFSGSQRCRLNRKLVLLAEDLRYRRITVSQISEPTEKCPYSSGCVATCNLKDPHLVALCDADRIAWNAYRKPKPNAVVLIDSRGDVAAMSSLANLESVVAKAGRLVD
jgi:hypothetical protein